MKVILCIVVLLLGLEGNNGHAIKESGWEFNANAKVSTTYFEREDKEEMVYNGYLREAYRPLIVSVVKVFKVYIYVNLRKKQF